MLGRDNGRHAEGGQRVHHGETQHAQHAGAAPELVSVAALILIGKGRRRKSWDLPCMLRWELGFWIAQQESEGLIEPPDLPVNTSQSFE